MGKTGKPVVQVIILFLSELKREQIALFCIFTYKSILFKAQVWLHKRWGKVLMDNDKIRTLIGCFRIIVEICGQAQHWRMTTFLFQIFIYEVIFNLYLTFLLSCFWRHKVSSYSVTEALHLCGHGPEKCTCGSIGN